MFYIEKDDEIVLFDNDRKSLLNTINFMPQYKNLEIKETNRPIENFQFADTDEYYTEKLRQERQRLDKLSLTKREVFLALFKDKGITPEQLKTQIESPESLIEFEYANEYFRGNPLINLIGEKLGYTSADLDYLFENKELPKEEEG